MSTIYTPYKKRESVDKRIRRRMKREKTIDKEFIAIACIAIICGSALTFLMTYNAIH